MIALVGLVIHGIGTFNAPPDPDVEKTTAKLAKSKQLLATNPPLVFPEVNYHATLQKKWDKLASAPEMYNGMMYRPTIPTVVYTVTAVAPKKVIQPPIMGLLTVDPQIPDRIVITWTKNTQISIKPLAVISGYRIYRRVAGEKQDKLLTEIKSSAEFSYTDTDNMQPEQQYSYYITAITDEKPEEMENGKTESVPSAAKQITTPENVRLNAEVANPEQVYMSIEKYIGGKWLKTRDYFKKGEKIGKGKFETEYEITGIKEGTVDISIDPLNPQKTVKKVFFRITLKHAKTGKEITKETKPVTK